MEQTNFGKYNVVIADDDPFGIEIVNTIIKNAGLSNYLFIHECDYVEIGSENNTLGILIENLNRLDIAIIDWWWEDEFKDQELEAGGKRAADIVRSKFPDCKIIFSTNFPRNAEDEKIDLKYNAIHLTKETSDAALRQGKKRLENTIKECIKYRLFEIDSSDSSQKEFLQCIQNNVIQWNNTITINNEEWKFEDLFFVYKNDIEELRNVVLSGYGLGYIPVKFYNIGAKKCFVDNLIDYYKLLYFDYYDAIDYVLIEVNTLLDKLKKLITIPINININDVINSLSVYNIASVCPSIIHNKSIAFDKFQEKLILRLFYISAYIIFELPSKIIYYLISGNTTVQDEVVRQISQNLFIFNMKHRDQPGKIYGYIGIDDDKGIPSLPPSKKCYESLINDSCLKYEKKFIIKYFKSIEKDEVMSKLSANNINLIKMVFNRLNNSLLTLNN